MAWGYADEGGLTVRRYFKQHFVTWGQIRKATWGGWDFARLVVMTEHPIEGSKRLDFMFLGSTWHAFRRTWIPENVALNRVNRHARYSLDFITHPAMLEEGQNVPDGRISLLGGQKCLR
jgi:hypothetical protein